MPAPSERVHPCSMIQHYASLSQRGPSGINSHIHVTMASSTPAAVCFSKKKGGGDSPAQHLSLAGVNQAALEV